MQQGPDQSTLVARRPPAGAHRRAARAQRRVRLEHRPGRALPPPALPRRGAARGRPRPLLRAARRRRQGAAGLRARLQPRPRHRHGVLRRRRAHQRREPRPRPGLLGPALPHPGDRRAGRLDQGHLRGRVGDFGTAGSTSFRMADHAAESVAQARARAVDRARARSSSSSRPTSATSGAWSSRPRSFYENGPFIHPEDYGRLNGYVKATRVLDERSEISFMAMAYSGSWNMSGVLPGARRLRRGRRDADAGGVLGVALHQPLGLGRSRRRAARSQRVMAWTEYRRQIDAHWDLKATALRAALEPPALPERRHRRLASSRTASSTARRSSRTTRAPRPAPTCASPHRDDARRHADAHDARAADPRRRHRERSCTAPRARVRLDGIDPEHPRAHLRRAHQRDRDRRLRRGGGAARAAGCASCWARAATASTPP